MRGNLATMYTVCHDATFEKHWLMARLVRKVAFITELSINVNLLVIIPTDTFNFSNCTNYTDIPLGNMCLTLCHGLGSTCSITNALLGKKVVEVL